MHSFIHPWRVHSIPFIHSVRHEGKVFHSFISTLQSKSFHNFGANFQKKRLWWHLHIHSTEKIPTLEFSRFKIQIASLSGVILLPNAAILQDCTLKITINMYIKFDPPEMGPSCLRFSKQTTVKSNQTSIFPFTLQEAENFRCAHAALAPWLPNSPNLPAGVFSAAGWRTKIGL